tara:strand:- start:823 stop:1032 length:210 start_codon:yes stop_codon:yes gene_type:complete
MLFDFGKKNRLIKELKEENVRLLDENESLWQMLDEISAAEIANYSEMLQDMILEKQQDALMATSKKAEA